MNNTKQIFSEANMNVKGFVNGKPEATNAIPEKDEQSRIFVKLITI